MNSSLHAQMCFKKSRIIYENVWRGISRDMWDRGGISRKTCRKIREIAIEMGRYLERMGGGNLEIMTQGIRPPSYTSYNARCPLRNAIVTDDNVDERC